MVAAFSQPLRTAASNARSYDDSVRLHPLSETEYTARITEKKWRAHWPNVTVELP